MIDTAAAPFERRPLERSGPNRGAATLYRSAASGGKAVGGVPLNTVEDAVTAAVRLGYKIAEAQIDRTARIGKRLREAGDRAAGPKSDVKALDATEQLVFRAMMAGLGWLEGIADDRGNPLKRLATAEFRLLGSLLGLIPPDQTNARPSRDQRESSTHQRMDAQDRQETGGTRQPRGRVPLQIRHEGKAPDRRAVEIRQWEFAGDAAADDYPITFHRSGSAAATLKGALSVDDSGSAILTLATTRKTASGPWKGAVCDKDGLQLGYIEIAM